MENYIIEHDIRVICITAEAFPQGVQAAFGKLHSLLPSLEGRTTYGISYSEHLGKIIYKAAATELSIDESEKFGCESFIIKKGTYKGVVINNFMNNIPQIGQTFQTLLQDPDLDLEGYCLEIYINDADVQCLVKLR